jgi:hypothetical protein
MGGRGQFAPLSQERLTFVKRTTSSVLSTGGLIGAAVLALVAGSAVAPGAASITRLAGPSSQIRAHIARPDACNVSKTEPIDAAGGAFKLPPCAGTTGKVTYGPNNAPGGTTTTLLSSGTNPAPSDCGSASGETTLAYVLATGNGSGSVSYASTNKKSMLKNAAFPPSATFTLVAFAFGIEQFAEPLGHPSAKHVLKFASPLNGMNLPLGLTFCFELDTP